MTWSILNYSKNHSKVFKCLHSLSTLLPTSYSIEPIVLLPILGLPTFTLLKIVLTKEKQLLPFFGESTTTHLSHTSLHTSLDIHFLRPGKPAS